MSLRGDGNGFVIRRDFSASVRVRPPAPNSEIYANKEDAKLTGVLGAFPPLYAGVAQLVEQLICNQQVGGSSPSTSSKGIQTTLIVWRGCKLLKLGQLDILDGDDLRQVRMTA